MRSEGQVRFITISSRIQKVAAASVVIIALVWAASLVIAGWAQYSASADRLSLLNREAKVATSEERLAAYGDNLEEVSEDLDRRMEFIEGQQGGAKASSYQSVRHGGISLIVRIFSVELVGYQEFN